MVAQAPHWMGNQQDDPKGGGQKRRCRDQSKGFGAWLSLFVPRERNVAKPFPVRREPTRRIRPPTRWRQGAFEATRKAGKRKGGEFLIASPPSYHGRARLTFGRRGGCLGSTARRGRKLTNTLESERTRRREGTRSFTTMKTKLPRRARASL